MKKVEFWESWLACDCEAGRLALNPDNQAKWDSKSRRRTDEVVGDEQTKFHRRMRMRCEEVAKYICNERMREASEQLLEQFLIC